MKKPRLSRLSRRLRGFSVVLRGFCGVLFFITPQCKVLARKPESGFAGFAGFFFYYLRMRLAMYSNRAYSARLASVAGTMCQNPAKPAKPRGGDSG